MKYVLLLVLFGGSLGGVGASRQNKAPVPAFQVEAMVVEVRDGDTIKVRLKGDKTTITEIRLYGINTAELTPPHNSFSSFEKRCEHIRWAQRAKEFTESKLPAGTKVLLMSEQNMSKLKTVGGRKMAYVMVNGQDLSELLVLAGLAWVYSDTYDSKYKVDRTPRYLEAEKIARSKAQGWHVYMPPSKPNKNSRRTTAEDRRLRCP